MGSGLEKREKASRWLTGMGKEKKQENESSLKGKKRLPELNVRSM